MNSFSSDALGPQRIVCLTEETTEWLYLLGQERRIIADWCKNVAPTRAAARAAPPSERSVRATVWPARAQAGA